VGAQITVAPAPVFWKSLSPMETSLNWRTVLWLLLSTVLLPAVLSLSVGILIIVFYRESWDVAFGVLVLCFAVFAAVGSSITVFLLRRLARLAQMQTEFISNVSHELRTPLTSIRMFVETLTEGRVDDPEDRRRCLELLSKETERMDRLVRQVLDFRQLSSRGAPIALSRIEAPALLRSVLAPFELDPEQRARLRIVEEPALPGFLGNEEGLRQAILNLVSNALKYSGDGPVVVTARCTGEEIAFSVRDSGLPIPSRERRQIFERFYRVAGTGKPGTGLGLAIARQVAEAHGGSLDLRGSDGGGNVFTLKLPLQPRPSASAAKNVAPPTAES
jgi:two-component system, OmpR family, phosphate regulon sensor histidine kinase PhoR